jgi:signal transduction histidine kinase
MSLELSNTFLEIPHQPTLSLSVLRDITERKRAEENIQKLNRVYAVLSNVNQTIVRIHDRQKLFDEICKVAVEDGKFRMAWIGLLDENSRNIKEVAHNGFVDDYFKGLNMDINNDETESSPLAIAIKTKKYFVSNDIEHDDLIEIWRVKAIKNNCRSFCVLPLIVFGKAYGVLNFFSDRENFFDEKELKLLEELALDVSFAIETIYKEEERKKAIEEMIKAKEKAEEANRLKSGFISSMSHEIRTPLNVIIGYSGIIKNIFHDPKNKEVNLYFNAIERAGERLINTITQILDISGIEAKEFPINLVPISLNSVVRSVSEQLGLFAPEKNISIRLELPQSDPYVLGDDYCLNGILVNLLNNAIKFSRKGEILIKTFDEKDNEYCIIKDEGIGMSKNYQKHLFEPFSQEEVGISRSFEGTRLGLALTKRYLELMNGEIKVESKKGVGTTFTFRLPLAK